MTIRAARADEAAILAALHLGTAIEAYAGIFPPEAPVPTLEETEAQWSVLLEPDGVRRVFVAEDSGTVVGVAVAGLDPGPTSADAVGHLSRLYVAPPHWSQGIGGTLHRRCLDHLRSHALASATLWVLEANTKARSFYERRGWAPTGERKVVYEPDGIVDVQYRLDLGARS